LIHQLDAETCVLEIAAHADGDYGILGANFLRRVTGMSVWILIS